LRAVAPHFSVALVTGETGTARSWWPRPCTASARARQGLSLPVNCSAIVDTLFESSCSATCAEPSRGATEHRVGLFERANGGVLFLDDVGELAPPMQAKLLRVLETGDVMRVGFERVASRGRACHRGEQSSCWIVDVREGRFRADLFYRLNSRAAHSGAARAAGRHPAAGSALRDGLSPTRFDRDRMAIDHEVLARLALQPWPGNVRELRNRDRTHGHAGRSARARERGAGAADVPSQHRASRVTCDRLPISNATEILRALAETAGTRRKRRAGWVSAGARSIAASRSSVSTRRGSPA
jgi:DNA-binding NtrC family response regulator